LLDLQLLAITHIQFLQQHVTHLAPKTRPYWVALRLNQRLRETLGFKTPAAKLQASVASIH
jgi:hypothetical protein